MCLNLSSDLFDLCSCIFRNLIITNSKCLRDLTIAQNLDGIGSVLDDTCSIERISIDKIASVELRIKTGNVHRNIFNAIEVAETGKFRKTTCKRSLTTFECALSLQLASDL